MTSTLERLPIPISLAHFDVWNLIVESKALKNNPLGDSYRRNNYVLKPRIAGQHPVVFHLSGYFSNGYQAFDLKTLEDNFPERIDHETGEQHIPLAHHVFVDATTSLGGSQFINSRGCGRYADYLQQDLVAAVEKTLQPQKSIKYRALLGSSSGGYGALMNGFHNTSSFGVFMAVAPDSGFELSLLPEYYKVSEFLKEIPDVQVLRKKLKDERFRNSKHFFSIMNCVAMALCYSDNKNTKINYPIDLQSGLVIAKEFLSWKKKDPVNFLKTKKIAKNKFVYLSVGRFDEFQLQFGARSIHELFKKQKVKHQYVEFDGGHFNSTPRKIEALRWLQQIWK